MREYDQFVGGSFVWFTGVVEDTNDTSNLGRVKVRCFGFHTSDKSILTTNDLPWALVMGPATSAGVQGIGTNHRLLSGSWVVGFFRDGPSAQDPIVLGSIPSEVVEGPDTQLGFTGSYGNSPGLDMPLLAQDNSTNTQVTHTPGGHTIEINDTPLGEHITVTHMSGTYLQLHQNGTVEINSSNDTVNIIGNTTVTGTVRASDEITAKYEGEESVTLTGHTHVEVPGTGGSSSPTPATQQTASPTAGT